MPGHGTLPFEAALAAARAAWPGVHVPEGVFRAYVAARTGDQPLAEDVAAALWLACACGRGDVAALRAFDAAYTPQVERAVARSTCGV
jgi:hypothetical protein